MDEEIWIRRLRFFKLFHARSLKKVFSPISSLSKSAQNGMICCIVHARVGVGEERAMLRLGDIRNKNVLLVWENICDTEKIETYTKKSGHVRDNAREINLFLNGRTHLLLQIHAETIER